jgi:hypothetical protein
MSLNADSGKFANQQHELHLQVLELFLPDFLIFIVTPPWNLRVPPGFLPSYLSTPYR